MPIHCNSPRMMAACVRLHGASRTVQANAHCMQLHAPAIGMHARGRLVAPHVPRVCVWPIVRRVPPPARVAPAPRCPLAADIISKAEGYLGGPLERSAVDVHTVRDVAPNKIMLCLSFRLPEGVAFKGRV